MKLIVREKLECGEEIRFAVELQEEFSCYKPGFLREHFTRYMMSAVTDLRSPDHMHIAIHLNDKWFETKVYLFSKIGSSPDTKLLNRIMNEVKTDFIEPEGGCK